MSDGEEWGEWQIHDGKGCPLSVGTYVQIRFEWPTCGRMEIGAGPLTEDRVRSAIWIWPRVEKEWRHPCTVAAYRIRKPRGLTILQNLIADLPAPVAPKVTA